MPIALPVAYLRIFASLYLAAWLTACAGPARTVAHHDDTARSHAPPSPGDAALSVVTFNLYHDAADWSRREPLVVSGLRALRPDVIALQEVLQHEGLPNQAGTLAQALGYEWRFFSTDPPDRARRYGNALLTRRPVLGQSERRLRPDEDNRIAGHLRIEVDGHPVAVYGSNPRTSC